VTVSASRPVYRGPGVRKSREGGHDGHDTDGVAW
jgi:hypothetical protein